MLKHQDGQPANLPRRAARFACDLEQFLTETAIVSFMLEQLCE